MQLTFNQRAVGLSPAETAKILHKINVLPDYKVLSLRAYFF